VRRCSQSRDSPLGTERLEIAHALEEWLPFVRERLDCLEYVTDAHRAPVSLRPADDAWQGLAACAPLPELQLRPLVPGQPNVAVLDGEGEDLRIEGAVAKAFSSTRRTTA
jgi:hypothetical protein